MTSPMYLVLAMKTMQRFCKTTRCSDVEFT